MSLDSIRPPRAARLLGDFKLGTLMVIPARIEETLLYGAWPKGLPVRVNATIGG
jgi:hypothetical protein